MSDKGLIPIDELRERICALLDHVKSVHGETIELDEDYYWKISSKNLYKVAEDSLPPKEIGSLYEDWEFLCKLKDADYTGPALMLDKAAPLLRYIGEKVGV
jgi:hypothetical protein